MGLTVTILLSLYTKLWALIYTFSTNAFVIARTFIGVTAHSYVLKVYMVSKSIVSFLWFSLLTLLKTFIQLYTDLNGFHPLLLFSSLRLRWINCQHFLLWGLPNVEFYCC